MSLGVMLCCVCMVWLSILVFFFFFQAEDGIRDGTVTGVQTCALPIFIPRTRCMLPEDDERGAAADALLLKNELSRDTVTSTMQRVRGMTETDHVKNA